MSNLQISNQPAFSPRTILMRLLPTLIYAALVPYLIYRVGSEHYHLSAVNALLLAAISPAVGSLIKFVRERQLSVLGLFALAGIAAKVVSALLFHDAPLVLIGDSLLSGVYGLLLLGSVLIGKPVVVVLATSMYAKSPEQRTQMKQSLQAFRDPAPFAGTVDDVGDGTAAHAGGQRAAHLHAPHCNSHPDKASN